MKRLYIFVVTCLFFVSCTCASASVSSEDSSGANPSGANPSGVTPSGVTPTGTNPSGVTPSGANPSGVTPSGASNDNPSIETGTASIMGTVWMPANNPTALSNPSHAIPVFDALIYISSIKSAPLERGVLCIGCELPSQKHVFSKHDGTFYLNGFAGGDYWVTITKAGFRRSFEITIADDERIELDETQTTLPSIHDPEQGAETPSIALVTGNYENLEAMLGKMGMGQLTADNTFMWGSEQGIFDVYDGYMSEGNSSVKDLLLDIELMSQYQMILFSCSRGWDNARSMVTYPPVVWQNIRDYINRGGKMYVTDWSGDYIDNIFPEQMTFVNNNFPGENQIDTPASAWDGTNWHSVKFGSADGRFSYNVHHAYAMDDDLRAWLTGQEGPISNSGIGSINGENFLIVDAWTQIQSTQSVTIGVDDEGQSIVDTPRVYVMGDVSGVPTSCPGAGCQPMTVTFEPVGCGRVMYSTYHTIRRHEGLSPQERILMYLMLEIGACKSGPIIN